MKRLLFIPFLILSIAVFAQSEKSIIDFDDEKISLEEFKRVYLKNNSGEIVSKSTVEEYLELYINFKLKVKEAISQGLDQDESFITELKGYRTQLAQPYLSEEHMLEQLKVEAYDRLKYEIRASHILINSKPTDSPEDTLAAYKKALKYRKLILAGNDFESVAQQYSEDPSAKQNKGDLGYFTGFYMVYPFETAAYNTKVGEVSLPVRTRFGYHLVKVTDRRETNGTMTASHILISNDPESGNGKNAEEKANEIYNLILEDSSFEEMASQFSDDPRSANNGGLLPPFTVGKMIREFELIAFGLKKDGEISKPVETRYGWHIIKRINKEKLAPYSELEKDIERKVKKDSRSNLTEGAAIKKIRNEYGFVEYIKERDDYYKIINESFFTDEWDESALVKLNKTLFKIGNKEVNQKEFSSYLMERKGANNNTAPQTLIDKLYRSFKKEQILEYKDSQLENEYPEFKAIIQEYHDGILLFNLTDQLVWSKAVKDTLGIVAFYEDNKESYKWTARADAIVFSALNSDVVKSTKKLIEEDKEIIAVLEEVNKSSQLNLKKEQKKYQKGENEFVDQVKWEKGYSKEIESNGRIYFVYIKEVLEPAYKTLEDSKGIITSDYQEFLEKEWIESLRKKYSFKVNEEVVKELKSQLQN